MELEIIEQEEMLAGLMTLTDGNMGLSYSLLNKVIKKTELEVKATLKDIADNIDKEKRSALRRIRAELNKNMLLSPNHLPKPKFTANHHIAAATDSRAEKALKILLKWGINFNHGANGVQLPQYKKHVPHKSMPKAIAHSQTHTNMYHTNVFIVLMRVDLVAASKNDIIKALREIGKDLQAGTFPINELINEA